MSGEISSKPTKSNANLPETPTPVYEGPITLRMSHKLIKNSEMLTVNTVIAYESYHFMVIVYLMICAF